MSLVNRWLQHLIEVEQSLKQKQKGNFDERHRVHELPTLLPGDNVWLSDRREEGRVEEQVGTRSYEVESNGTLYRRNRRDLISVPSSSDSISVPSSSDSSLSSKNLPQVMPQQLPTLRRSTRVTSKPDRLDPSSE